MPHFNQATFRAVVETVLLFHQHHFCSEAHGGKYAGTVASDNADVCGIGYFYLPCGNFKRIVDIMRDQ